jgi:hypothetical protein
LMLPGVREVTQAMRLALLRNWTLANDRCGVGGPDCRTTSSFSLRLTNGGPALGSLAEFCCGREQDEHAHQSGRCHVDQHRRDCPSRRTSGCSGSTPAWSLTACSSGGPRPAELGRIGTEVTPRVDAALARSRPSSPGPCTPAARHFDIRSTNSRSHRYLEAFTLGQSMMSARSRTVSDRLARKTREGPDAACSEAQQLERLGADRTPVAPGTLDRVCHHRDREITDPTCF